MKRTERSRWLKELRSNQASGFGTLGKAQRKAKKLKEMADFCESDLSRLLLFGDVFDEGKLKARDPQTIEEVLESVLSFARALKMENPIVEGTTLRMLVQSVFEEWQKQRCPLLNPYTKHFSTDWEIPEGKEVVERIFEEVWLCTEGDYDAPLMTPPEAKLKPNAQEQFDDFQNALGEAPIALFSSFGSDSKT